MKLFQNFLWTYLHSLLRRNGSLNLDIDAGGKLLYSDFTREGKRTPEGWEHMDKRKAGN